MENQQSTSRPASEKGMRLSSNSRRSQSSVNKLEPPPLTPAYGVTAMLMQPSPMMTSSLHSRNSATSAQESAYLQQAKYLQWGRSVLSLLTIATAIAAVGCEGHVLQRYNATHLGSGHHLPPLWPLNVDLKPNLAILTSACIVVVVSLSYLVVSFVPTPYSRTRFYNLLFLASSATNLVLCLYALPFSNLLTSFSSYHQRESIQSWTCKFSHGASQFTSDAHALQLPVYVFDGIPVPAGFKRLCMESEVGQGLVAALLGLEIVSCALAAVGLGVEKKMAVRRRERYAVKDEKLDNMS